MQCLLGYAVFTEYNTECSIHRVTIQDAVITEEQCLPSEFLSLSLQWLPSSELLKAVSMNRVFTSTECMTMSGNAVDTEYQKVTELAQWTRVLYCWADFVKWYSLVFLADLANFVIGKVYIKNEL